jgi:hypothetical protein
MARPVRSPAGMARTLLCSSSSCSCGLSSATVSATHKRLAQLYSGDDTAAAGEMDGDAPGRPRGRRHPAGAGPSHTTWTFQPTIS